MNLDKLDVIEIIWDGPYPVDEVIKNATKAYDCGIYQIYGTHNIFGPNSLLYIGKAPDSFSHRISWHKDWIDWEASEVQVYLGKLGGKNPITDKEWTDKIDHAERLLIYYSAPPYNSKGLSSHGVTKPTIVLNYGHRNRLPMEVSTLYEESNYVLDRQSWKEFGS